MKPLLTVALLVICIEIVCPFAITFRDPTVSSTTERTKRRPSLHEIFFGTTSTTTIKTTTTTEAATLPPAVTILPTQETLNSKSQWNITSAHLNSTDPSLLDNSTTIIDTSKTRSSTRTESCRPEIDQDGENKSYYLTDNDIRLKLCSNINSSLLREYRFDLDAKVCSPVGKQSHCGKNMIFYSYAGNNVYGHCDCDYNSQIPLLYHHQTSRCYFMYQQGYCGPEEWLELSQGNGTGVCTKNKCFNVGRTKFGSLPLAARDIAPEYVPLRGTGPCVILNQPNQQFCKNKGDIVTFRWPLELYPNCGQPVKKNSPPEGPSGISGRFLGEVASLKCNPGSYLNVAGGCEPEWEFD